MRKRIALVSALGLIILAGFNNCGEGFQSNSLDSIGLSSITDTNPQSPNWSTWSEWQASNSCNVQCEDTEISTRVCLKNNIQVSNEECSQLDGGSNTQSRTVSCNLVNGVCPPNITNIDGGWTNWSDWKVTSECSLMCEQQELRERSCTNPTPAGTGKNCDTLDSGLKMESRTVACNIVDGKCKTNTPDKLILDFQFDKSGVGLIKYNRAIEEDTTFTVTLEVDAPVKDFLRVLYKEPIAPFSKSLDVTIKAGESEKAFNFEELLKPLLDLNGNIPDKVNIKAKLNYKALQNEGTDLAIRGIQFIGNPNAIKGAYSSYLNVAFLRNDNTLCIYSPNNIIIAKDTCRPGINSLDLGDETPLMMIEGGTSSIYILTKSNNIIFYNIKSNINYNPLSVTNDLSGVEVSKFKIPESIKVKKIRGSQDSITILSEDDRVYRLSHRRSKNFQESLRRQSFKVKDFTLPTGHGDMYKAVFLSLDNKIYFYDDKNITPGLPRENVFKIFPANDNVMILYEDGSLKSVSGQKIAKLTETKIINFDTNNLLDISHPNSRTLILNIQNSRTLKSLFNGRINWNIGDVAGTNK